MYVDQTTAHHLRRLFELYASGKYHLREVSKILYEEGFRNRSGRKIPVGTIHRTLQNPFYYGMMLQQGKLYEGSHQPIITKELFDQAQDVRLGKLHSRKQKLFFSLRGLLKCAHCGCMLTASLKKGHEYYYCTNGKGICDENRKGYLKPKDLDKFVSDIFEKLQVDDTLIDLTYKAKKEFKSTEVDYAAKNAETIQKRLAGNAEAQSRLCDSFSAGNTPEGVYNAKMLALVNEEKALQKQLKDIPHTGQSTLEPTRKIFIEANKAKDNYLNGSPEEKRIIAQNLLWNLSIKDREPASYQLKQPYDRLVLMPKPHDLATMWTYGESNSALLHAMEA